MSLLYSSKVLNVLLKKFIFRQKTSFYSLHWLILRKTLQNSTHLKIWTSKKVHIFSKYYVILVWKVPIKNYLFFRIQKQEQRYWYLFVLSFVKFKKTFQLWINTTVILLVKFNLYIHRSETETIRKGDNDNVIITVILFSV